MVFNGRRPLHRQNGDVCLLQALAVDDAEISFRRCPVAFSTACVICPENIVWVLNPPVEMAPQLEALAEVLRTAEARLSEHRAPLADQ